MNILILGAGGHGRVVAEVAESCGYDRIEFLDDESPTAIGKMNELENFREQFPHAFVGIGDNKLRGGLIERLEKAGYQVPVLLHPTAYVSRTARIEKGTVVGPMAVVNANSVVGVGCIIQVGGIVDHDAVLGDYVHVNAGSVVKAGASVEAYTKLEAGQVILGYR